MATYIILTSLTGNPVEPKDFKERATAVSTNIKDQCPGVVWKESFMTMGRFDIIDIVESDEPQQVEKACMIIRSSGLGTTETLCATKWDEFLDAL